jgi:CBS domain containing-hemolysin-like protein
MDWFELLLIPLLIAANAFFVSAEYALVAIRSTQIEQMRKQGYTRAAAITEKLKRDPASAIGAIQVCITMTNLLLGAMAEEPMKGLFVTVLGEYAKSIPSSVIIAFSFVIVTLLTVVFSELLPKAVTLKFVPIAARLTGGVVLVILAVTRPLVWVMNVLANLVAVPLGLGRVDQVEKEYHTAEEIRMIAAEAANAGELSLRERSLILNSLAFGRRTARQIMVPRVKVAFLDIQKPLQENRDIMESRLFSRLPLCDGGLANIIGVVLTREFLFVYNNEADSSIFQLIAKPVVYAPDTISLDKLLILFDEQKTQIVMLVDETGGFTGIVTLRDVVDELVGLPMDQSNRPAATKPFTLPGDTPLHEFALRIGHESLEHGSSVVTLGGLVVERLGRFPDRGDEITLDDGTILRVLNTARQRVKRVEVVPKALAMAQAMSQATSQAKSE